MRLENGLTFSPPLADGQLFCCVGIGWGGAEARQQAEGPNHGEEEEACEDVDECGSPQLGFWMEIAVDRVVDRGKQHCKDSAAEPCERAGEKSQSIGLAFGREPVALIGKINLVDGEFGDEAGNSKRDEGSERDGAGEEGEEHCF